MIEYWCDRKILVTIDGPHRHSTIRIEKPFARIGSHPGSDIVLDHDDVDKRSLYLHATNAGIFCFGLSAAQSDLKGWMDPNEAVAVGPYWISAQLTDPVQLRDHDPNDDVFGLTDPSPELLVRCDGDATGRFHLKRRLSILGRKAPCKLRLQGQEISGAHCVFFVDGQQTWVIDLLSAAGTIVRGKSCDVERLAGGERMTLANVELVLHQQQDEVKDQGAQKMQAPGGTVLEPAPALITDSSESVNLFFAEVGAEEAEDEESDTWDGSETWTVASKLQEELHAGRYEEETEARTRVSKLQEGDEETRRQGEEETRTGVSKLQEDKTESDEHAETQHPNRPLSAEIDKIFVSKMAKEEKATATAAVPKSKPRPADENRQMDELDRVTSRLVDIEIHRKRKKLWGRAARLVVFLLVSAICVGGLAVAYQMLPDNWKPVWGQRESE